MARQIFHFLGLTSVIGFLWIGLYSLNHILFKMTEITPYISLIFIPSGFKIACASIFRERSILGIFLGSLITGFLFLKKFSMVDVVIFSCFSATLPFMAFMITEQLLPTKTDLSNLCIKRIALLSVVYAVFNGFFHIAYRYHVLFLRDPHKTYEFLAMALGDILGILVFMLLVAKATKYLWIQKLLQSS